MRYILLLLCLQYSLCKKWDKHHTNPEISAFLEKTNRRCPGVSHVYLLNDSGDTRTDGGNNLTAIAFGINAKEKTNGIPEFKYVANMHGNEVVGRELLLRLADDLCTRWQQKDPAVVELIKMTRIHLLPTMNPDGWDRAFNAPLNLREEIGRENAKNVDLNRDFPNLDFVVFRNALIGKPVDHLYNFKDDKNKNAFQKETRMIMQWMDENNFVLSANMHDGDLVANYPYDSSPSGRPVPSITPDHQLFLQLAESYADHNQEMRAGLKPNPGMDKDFRHGTVNGADWYPINGSMQDYNYLATNAFEITLELSWQKFPPAEMLPAFWNQNRASLYNFMAQVHRGIKGSVQSFDGHRMKPLSGVTVKVTDITDPDEVVAITHNILSDSNGYYYRLLNRGRYAVTFEAKDHEPAVSCIEVDKIPRWGVRVEPAKVLHVILFRSTMEIGKERADKLNELAADLTPRVHSHGESHCGDLPFRLESQHLAQIIEVN